jgi:two-component system KDP operon response regulator KdpE
MKTIRVLVVDDEEPIREFIKRNLEIRGYRVSTASNGHEALALYDQEPVNLVILDVMMPTIDGEERDKIQAFNLGADDYLTKPFGVGELLARVKAVLRRAQWEEVPIIDERLEHGVISVDVARHIVDLNGEDRNLTPTEFNLLVLMIKNVGKVLSHERILKQIWGPEYGQETEYLRVYIGRLRQKLEKDPTKPEYLHTEHGIGYCFEKRE